MAAATGKVGFIGLGIMGVGMANNLLKSGRKLVVWNRSTAKAEDFAAKYGAESVATPKAVVEACDVTYSCLTTPEVARAVHFHEETGSFLGISAGKSLVECSTLDVATMQAFDEAIKAKGGRFLEAPVSGSKGPAEQGTLIFLCGGDKTLFDEVRPNDLEAMGKASFYLGPTGKGSEMKLVVNMIMGGMMASLVEGTSLAQSSDLPLESLCEILSLGALGSPMVKGKLPKIIKGEYDPHFPLKHQQKDLRLALELGENKDQPLPVISAANDLLVRACDLGHGDKDFSACFEAAKKQ
uniref:6-phosphogluconate dehydrogenase NADP-binding domain-containing protein n=1 Tax=Paramoeba aestuarina TaxID=180227 RepID=A0A7S4NXR3_9EUKA|eukprot:CAMPEP_0201522470 /NCGR_PEP_ID=MMETSP0161_2-20130828/17579_1 /ASSEMBLY_ACC=CAM_ASM_000251 /TAXON_ID=180227 /ORGANISM="Neoparamoeba aestuarina, Strain SoJaBio B1-5/56/2" /LENGTH=295 /DNA_ID=CAMNT_0047921319 /DNA_START=61 /DNA_END=948 /DNA_ORIENTATION=+